MKEWIELYDMVASAQSVVGMKVRRMIGYLLPLAGTDPGRSAGVCLLRNQVQALTCHLLRCCGLEVCTI